MQNLRNERGITIVTLVITIIVLLMISTPIIVNFKNIGEVSKYSSFQKDIDTLRESIEIAYRDDIDISSIGPKYEGTLSMLNEMQGNVKVKNDNDNENYYIIDLAKLNQRLRIKIDELNYGKRNQNSSDTSNDVYIINEKSRTIYYVPGIEYNGTVYHRKTEKFTSNDSAIIPGQEVKDINKVYTDIYGSKAMIPVGYAVSTIESEQIISKGLVIKDSKGNEFVWIPTTSIYDENKNKIDLSFARDSFGTQSKGEKDNITNSTKIFNNGDNKNYFYEKMSELEQKSVSEYGGFYIARYETGAGSSRNSTSVDTDALIQANKPVYNFVSKDKAVLLSNNFAQDNNYVTSRLCSSYAWDTMLNYLSRTGNSTYLIDASKGNHTNALAQTGQVQSDKINNIYDLSGNIYEWTLENTTKENLSVVRGGAISSSDFAVTRKWMSDEADVNIGFRIALFVK